MPKKGWRGLPVPHCSRSIVSEKHLHHAVSHSQKAARHLWACYIAAAILATSAVFAVMRVRSLAALYSTFSLLRLGVAQSGTLGLQDGFLSFDTPSFTVELVKDSQTLYSLKTNGNSTAFDFIPADVEWKAADHPLADSFYVWGPPPPDYFIVNHEVARPA